MPKTLIGRYNAFRYVIETPAGAEVYEAGNNPLDSQSYVDAKLGVGLATMKRYCESTLADMCAEEGAQNGGVEEMDAEEEETETQYGLGYMQGRGAA